MKIAKALTIRSKGGKLRVVSSEIALCLPLGQNIPKKVEDIDNLQRFNGIWDTGASGSVITEKVVQSLSLQPTGQKEVNTANGTIITNTYLVDFILPGNVLIQNVEVTEAKLRKVDILIGMDIITLGDFSITNLNNITVMTFRVPSMVEYDYVKEANNHNRLEQFKEARKGKGGSSKKKSKKSRYS